MSEYLNLLVAMLRMRFPGYSRELHDAHWDAEAHAIQVPEDGSHFEIFDRRWKDPIDLSDRSAADDDQPDTIQAWLTRVIGLQTDIEDFARGRGNIGTGIFVAEIVGADVDVVSEDAKRQIEHLTAENRRVTAELAHCQMYHGEPDSRQLPSLYKLVYGMARDKFRFDDGGESVVSNISNALERSGCHLAKGTISANLNKAKAYLDERPVR